MGKAIFQSRTDNFLRKRSDSEDRERDRIRKSGRVFVETSNEAPAAVEVDGSIGGGDLQNGLRSACFDQAKLTPSNDGGGEGMAPGVHGNDHNDLDKARPKDARRNEESDLPKPLHRQNVNI